MAAFLWLVNRMRAEQWVFKHSYFLRSLRLTYRAFWYKHCIFSQQHVCWGVFFLKKNKSNFSSVNHCPSSKTIPKVTQLFLWLRQVSLCLKFRLSSSFWGKQAQTTPDAATVANNLPSRFFHVKSRHSGPRFRLGSWYKRESPFASPLQPDKALQDCYLHLTGANMKDQ